MGATTTEGTGAGSVADVYPKIYNDVVKSDNLVSFGFTGLVTLTGSNTNPLTISAGPSDGGEGDNAQNLLLNGGTGNSEGDNDGGDVNIEGGWGNGTGEGGDVIIAGGEGGLNSSGSGNVIIEGGYARGAFSGGDIVFYGGYGNDASGVDSNGGSISMQAGNGAANGNGQGGSITLNAGAGNGTGDAGDINLTAGTANGSGSVGHITLNSMAIMPVFANATARDAAAGTPVNGMFCYNTGTGNIEVYVGGAWKSVDVSAIV